jgi:hypothetical protein
MIGVERIAPRASAGRRGDVGGSLFFSCELRAPAGRLAGVLIPIQRCRDSLALPAEPVDVVSSHPPRRLPV